MEFQLYTNRKMMCKIKVTIFDYDSREFQLQPFFFCVFMGLFQESNENFIIFLVKNNNHDAFNIAIDQTIFKNTDVTSKIPRTGFQVHKNGKKKIFQNQVGGNVVYIVLSNTF